MTSEYFSILIKSLIFIKNKKNGK